MPDELPPELITARVRDTAREVSSALDASGVERDAMSVDERLERLFALSPYVMETCRRRPAALARLLREGSLTREGADLDTLVAELRDELRRRDGTSSEVGTVPGATAAAGALGTRIGDGVAANVDGEERVADDDSDEEAAEAEQLGALRAFRHRHQLRILWRDLERLATLDATLADLTRLAEACIVVATRWAEAVERRRAGTPRDADGRAQRLIVLGMGKLGGGELNVSSDIDLICLWPEPGTTDGRRAVDNGEHFVRVAQRLTRLLGKITADGFAFRVDTRLRPFGESGPMAMNLDAFEHYLLTQGRDWERYAMVKARALTGEAQDIACLEGLLRPFVYRRYIDYDALVSLAELKAKIRQSVGARRGHDDDIKLGAGGIREVEFTGQAFQLVRGGREPRLQCRPIRTVLDTLGALGLLPRAEARALIEAYEYLRRVENALQAMRDEQTHVLPTSAEDRARLVAMLGETDRAAFEAALEARRAIVRRAFEGVLGGAGASAEKDKCRDLPAPPENPESAAAWLESFALAPAPELLERLAALSGGPFHRRLTARAQTRLETVLPRLARAAASAENPPVALARAFDFVRAVAGRSGYLQALADRPAALARLVRLFDASGWVAELATRYPIVVDELIGTSAATLFEDAASIRAEALAEAARLAEADLERQMDAMRQFRQTRELCIAAAVLDEELTPMQASDRLSWLAEGMIAGALALVAAPLAERYGRIAPAIAAESEEGAATAFGICVVAYGKLGGIELGFGSDLDLVFLRDDEEDAESTARLVRRFVHFMSTVTPAGRIHEIDLRLRPNGNAGVLVGTLESFARYQREEAWTWEHQALLRARPVYGSESLRERFAAVRLEVLCRPRPAETLRADVAAMRARMRATLGTHREGFMHLKQDAGGIADIEFIVQYLALAHAAEYPSLVRFSDNVRVLEAIDRIGLLPATEARSLAADYVALRERLHRRALDLADAVVPLDPALEALRGRVIERRERILGPEPERSDEGSSISSDDL